MNRRDWFLMILVIFERFEREKHWSNLPALHWCFSALSSSFVLLAHLDLASQGSRWKLLGECARRNDARLWTVLLWNSLLWWIKSQCIIVQGSATMTLGCLRSERSGQRFLKFLPFNWDNERTCEDFVKICRVLKNLVFPKSQHLLVTQCYTKLHMSTYTGCSFDRRFCRAVRPCWVIQSIHEQCSRQLCSCIMIILWYNTNTFVICIIMYAYI